MLAHRRPMRILSPIRDQYIILASCTRPQHTPPFRPIAIRRASQLSLCADRLRPESRDNGINSARNHLGDTTDAHLIICFDAILESDDVEARCDGLTCD